MSFKKAGAVVFGLLLFGSGLAAGRYTRPAPPAAPSVVGSGDVNPLERMLDEQRRLLLATRDEQRLMLSGMRSVTEGADPRRTVNGGTVVYASPAVPAHREEVADDSGHHNEGNLDVAIRAEQAKSLLTEAIVAGRFESTRARELKTLLARLPREEQEPILRELVQEINKWHLAPNAFLP